MMDVEAMLSLAAEDPSVTEWKPLENGLYIVTAGISSVRVTLGHCQKQDCDPGWLRYACRQKWECIQHCSARINTRVEILQANW